MAPDTTNTDADRLEPEDVLALRPDQTADGEGTADEVVENPAELKSPLAELLTPETRFLVVDALIDERGNDGPLTVAQIAQQSGVSQPSISRHLPVLADYGIVEQGEKMGNARTWRVNWHHPVVQLLAMADDVSRFGRTEMLLGEQFVRDE